MRNNGQTTILIEEDTRALLQDIETQRLLNPGRYIKFTKQDFYEMWFHIGRKAMRNEYKRLKGGTPNVSTTTTDQQDTTAPGSPKPTTTAQWWNYLPPEQ